MMLVSTFMLGLAAASADAGATSEEANQVEVRCFIKEGDEGFIPRLLDASIEKQENETPIDPDLMDEVLDALSLCAMADEYRDKDPEIYLFEILSAPIAAELVKRLNGMGVSTDRIDKIAVDEDRAFLSPQEFDAERKDAIRRYMASIDIPDRRRAYIYLIMYIQSQAVAHKQ